jgi:hypothetical protein
VNKITGGNGSTGLASAPAYRNRISPERRSADERVLSHGFSYYGDEEPFEEEGTQTPHVERTQPDYGRDRDKERDGAKVGEEDVDDEEYWNTVNEFEDDDESWDSDSDDDALVGAGGVGSRGDQQGYGQYESITRFSQPTPRRAFEPISPILRNAQAAYLEPPSHSQQQPYQPGHVRRHSGSPLANRVHSPEVVGGSTFSRSSLSSEVGEGGFSNDEYADEEGSASQSESEEEEEGLQMRSRSATRK